MAIYRIYPHVAKEENLLLIAIRKCSWKNELTLDEVWETMQRIRNPHYHEIHVISTPMG
jgi:hypothetical protein